MSATEPAPPPESDPPDPAEEASVAEIEALLRRCVRSLDRMLDMAERLPPPFRDPAPSAPPG